MKTDAAEMESLASRESFESSLPLRSGLLPAAVALWWRDVVRFYRQPSRILGAIGSPLVFWLLIGAGVGTSFRPPGFEGDINFLQYFYPGIIALILLFTAIFSTISIIEDRREGFLQGVLVAPVPRAGIVLGKLFGGTTLALLQGAIFLLLLPFAGLSPGLGALLFTVLAMAIVAFALTGLGFLIAWSMDSIQGFHAIMNLFLIPLWMLSGAFFPPEGAAGWIRVVMYINPLTYGVDALRFGLYTGEARQLVQFPAAVSLGVSFAFAAIMLAACTASARRNRVLGPARARRRRH